MVNYSRQISDTVARLPVSRLAEDDRVTRAAGTLLSRQSGVLTDLTDADLAALDVELLARWNRGTAAQRENIVAARRAVNREFCGRRS